MHCNSKAGCRAFVRYAEIFNSLDSRFSRDDSPEEGVIPEAATRLSGIHEG